MGRLFCAQPLERFCALLSGSIHRSTRAMSDSRIGLLAILGTYTIWGLSALYYAQLSHVPPLEVLAHRTVWSFLAFFAVILVQGRLRDLLGVLHPRTGWSGLYRIIPAAIFVSINWFLFVYAIQIDKTLEASLAYYISPLLAAAVGWVVFKRAPFGVAVARHGVGAVCGRDFDGWVGGRAVDGACDVVDLCRLFRVQKGGRGGADLGHGRRDHAPHACVARLPDWRPFRGVGR